ncbi:hypothetical protein BJY17_000788 [Agromyces hippuratus]|uniref:Uncharacterized protein n=1 Tax=Agromyces hippuratus TaxID=286438 RepID=A0A852X1M5_9MICO|nr:hypothetical protein [Agromyces hippuratus]NYG20041.1 hypothetical protein [Agromyces hippuratus]
MTTLVQHAPPSRWISVVFLDGDDAETVLELIDLAGPVEAIRHLEEWDFGDETTEAALENGYVYDDIPAGRLDRTAVDETGHYALTYSPHYGYVSLLRSYDASPDPTPAVALERPATEGERAIAEHPDLWFSPHHHSTSCPAHLVTR